MFRSRNAVLLLALAAVLVASACGAAAQRGQLKTAERMGDVKGVQPVSQLRWKADLQTTSRRRRKTDHSEEGYDCFCFLIWWLCICWY